MSAPGYNIFTETKNSNVGLMVITAVVSIIIHILLYIKVADARFNLPTFETSNPESASDSPLEISRLKDDPAGPLPSPEAGNPDSQPTMGISAEELAEIITVPYVEFAEPPPTDDTLDVPNITGKEVSKINPEDSVWQPRNEIIKITERIVHDKVATLPRKEIYDIERIDNAPDYVPAIDITKDIAIPLTEKKVAEIIKSENVQVKQELPQITDAVTSVAETVSTDNAITPAQTLTQFGEKPSDISDFKAVDSRLMMSAAFYRPEIPDGRQYFRLEVAPRENANLPTVPKDIIFVQDASRSLANQRLYFCKKGIRESFKFISDKDRFNIASFRNDIEFCFDDWQYPNETTLAEAGAFVDKLVSDGETDIFESLSSLMTLKRDPKRPLIVVLITDGVATQGMTNSTRIIGEFSKINDNMSLFVVGTQSRANAYLLDLISFCNRGQQTIVYNDRWSIPKAIEDITRLCANPILGRVAVTTDINSGAEIFPHPSANLYSDKTLVYYGSCPDNVSSILVQVRGQGGEAKCDSIFDLQFANARTGNSRLKDNWTKYKMYSLIGAYTRTPTQAILSAIINFHNKTKEPIPYYHEIMQSR